MNLRRLAASALAAAAAFATALTLAATPAHAACTYYGLDTLNTYAATLTPQNIQLTQDQPVWSAFAVRPVAGEDWDVTLYQNSAADPTCVTNFLTNSTYGGSIVDFVIGDYAHSPAGIYYASVNRFAGTNPAYVRWSNSSKVMTVNAPVIARSWSTNDVMETWNTNLTAGTNYTINFAVYAGAINAHVLLFHNPGGGTFWAGRPSADLNATAATTFMAPATGSYAVVVVSDDGGTGSFYLGIDACLPPTALVPNAPIRTNLSYETHSFNQVSGYWTAIGVHGGALDYDVAAYGGTAGPGYPTCLSDLKGSSTYGAGVTDVVVGDFNHNPTGTYYADFRDYSGTAGADIEWDSGSDLLTVDAPPIARSDTAGSVVEVWDVLLQAGQTYNFAFNQGSTNLHMLLFRNAGGGVYWAGRNSAVFDATGCTQYTAPSSGYYGVVVLNETGDASNYTLGVSLYPCYCPVALAPNTPTSAPSPDTYYRFDPPYFNWSVVATRGFSNADDWDLTVSGGATGNPSPVCLSTPLIGSSYGAGLVDIGIIDFNFNHTPKATTYVRTHHFSGGALAGLVEWDPSQGVIFANGPYQTTSMGVNDLAQVWDAYMEAGTTYQIEFAPSGGSGFQLMLFENAAGGSYYVNRSANVLTTSGNATYTPTVTGEHAFVVVNDAAGAGSYTMRYGTCGTPIALVNNTMRQPLSGLETYSFAAPASGWSAIGVRATGTDWDMRVSATQSGPFPSCVGAPLASSTSGALNFVDFVVGDFFHTPAATYYAQANQYSSGGLLWGPVEWSAGNGDIVVNDNNNVAHATDFHDVLQSWNVFMTAGTTYTFNFGHAGGANLHMLLFENALAGAYWTGRSGSVADLTPGGGPFNYVAPVTGYYGVVVANDDGGVDSYTLNVKACTTPTALASGVTTVDTPENFHSFNQATPYWTAVGVRSTTDWDIHVNSSVGGGSPGICQSGLLASSTGVGIVDFVVGDFNAGANATGTYFTRDFRFSGAATGTVEWDSGSDLISVAGPLTHRTTDANDVLEIWDVRLIAGQQYAIYFNHQGAADVKVMLFRNPGGAYWAPRTASVYTNATVGNFTAPSTGYYGLVVVNDNGAAGSYDVAVYNSALAVDPGAPAHVTTLRSIQPNPARSGMHVEYSLSERAPVRVEMLDLAGRVVAQMENGTRDAGVWQAGWNGLTASGRRAAPGIYMVRLEVDGRTIGQRKVTVLE